MNTKRNTKSLVCVLLLGFAFLNGCGWRTDTDPVPRTPVSEDVTELAGHNNQFAFDLYAQLRKNREGNLFFSPFSISTALSMTYAGARGETEAQIAEVLHFALTQDQLHRAMGSLSQDLDGGEKGRGYQLNIANRLWPRTDVPLLDSYLATLKSNYGADVKPLDFLGDLENSRQIINSWVEEETNDRIQELLQKGAISGDTALVLTNAIYFKGDWAKQFKKTNTRQQQFHVSSDESVITPMMYQNDDFRFGQIDDVKLLELPYQSGELSMLIVLPNDVDGLAAVESRLNAEILSAWQEAMSERELDVWLPKFTMTSEFSLEDTLTAMGMPIAFSGEADFSGMTGTGELFISAVVHKAFVEVNEEGTEAAAATAIAVDKAVAELSEFRADHPFLFVIRDNHTGSILFMGRVANPAA